VYGARSIPPIVKAARARPEVGLRHFLNIVPCFPERRDPSGSVDGTLTSIISRKGQIQVAIVPVEEEAQVVHPPVHIVFGISHVTHA
jgi:hypothetical protein